jgi:Zn-dependent protease
MQDFDISKIITQLIVLTPGFLLAITVHEFTHGYVAYRLGDPTAKQAGRLTFNPISHLDPFGTLALILTQMIGWAKPVPVDPRYLRNPRQDLLWISLGGPAANLAAATVLALLLHGIAYLFFRQPISQTAGYFLHPLVMILQYGVVINVGLAVFNLIPVPPLDGAAVLAGLLPPKQAYQFEKLEQYGFIILLILIVTGAVGIIIRPVVFAIVRTLLAGL